MGKLFTLEKAVILCRRIEAICPPFGCHVALTGGALYKDGERKDADILFYNVRQVDALDRPGLLDALQKIGFVLGEQHGWVQKATYKGHDVDLFFPEAFPSSSRASEPGTY